MLTCYRPTTLKLASAQCPRAVDYYEQHRPHFREQFSQGIAAHDCLASIGERVVALGRPLEMGEMVTVCNAVVGRLITQGRIFEGDAEPPMPAEDAAAGKALALSYASDEKTTWPTSEVWYERGLAFDAHWQPVPYGSEHRRFRLILDMMAVLEYGGEDYSGRVALVRDYKSSWATDESELATYQMKAQAIAAWLVLPDIDCVRREVVNLRTGQVFREDLWLESGGKVQLVEWRDEITAYMNALDKMKDELGAHPVRPGAGCLSCSWVQSCEFSAPMASEVIGLAQLLAQTEGRRAQLIVMLKLACAERAAEFDSTSVGWHKTEKPEAKSSAAMQMWAEWSSKNGDMAGFLTAIEPGMASLRAVAKKLYKDDKDEQARCISDWTQPKLGREFGVERKDAPQTNSIAACDRVRQGH